MRNTVIVHLRCELCSEFLRVTEKPEALGAAHPAHLIALKSCRAPGRPPCTPSENRTDRLKAQIMDRVLVLNQQGGEFGTGASSGRWKRGGSFSTSGEFKKTCIVLLQICTPAVFGFSQRRHYFLQN